MIPSEIDGLTVLHIGEYAFESCTNLTRMTLPESVTKIGNGAFSGCTGLTSVSIPEGVTEIGDHAFFRCTGLLSIECDSNNVNYKSINGVLFNKDETELVAFPGGFSGTYTIPAGVTKISRYAFCGCTGLTSVTIPESVTTIGNKAFFVCPNLTLHAPAGSVAEDYAKKNGIRFERL